MALNVAKTNAIRSVLPVRFADIVACYDGTRFPEGVSYLLFVLMFSIRLEDEVISFMKLFDLF